MEWNDWTLNRIFILAMGLLFLVIFLQVTLFHYRQNFHHWAMWGPVLSTPILGVILILYAFYNPNWLFSLVAILLSIGILEGLFGSFLHIRGVGKRVDGYKLRNFMIGPPLTLPALITAVSILGLFALYWG